MIFTSHLGLKQPTRRATANKLLLGCNDLYFPSGIETSEQAQRAIRCIGVSKAKSSRLGLKCAIAGIMRLSVAVSKAKSSFVWD